ncbi:MAG: ABC transporter substrate-binding protein [Acidimicrobiales bacterium]
MIALSLAAATTLAACGSSGTSEAVSKPAEVVPLVVYAAEGYDSTVCKAFQTKTGIPCQLEDHSTGTLLAKVSATKNNPHWGVLWTDGAEAYAALDQSGLLVKGFEPTAGSLNSLGRRLVPPDKSYVPTGVTIAGALVYDASVVTKPPTTWSQLLQPQWSGAVGMNNPALSGPTYPFVAGMFQQLGGVSQGEHFFKQLKANGLHVYGTNKVTLNALLQGQIKLAVVQNSAGIGFALKNPALRVAYPAKVTALPGVIGIDSKVSAPEISEAKMFANFVYSPAGQQAMLSGDPHGDSLFVPVVDGTVAHKVVPALASLPVQTTNPYKWGPRESTINQWFTANIVN